jgi:hypothetical protein
MSHHYGREQRRAKIIALLAAALLLALLVPLVLDADLRLRVVQALGLVPSHERELLFGSDDPVELVVLTEAVSTGESRVSYRYTAVYVAERRAEGVVLLDLAAGREIPLPLVDYDLIAAAADRSAVLVVDRGRTSDDPDQAVLVTVATGEIRPLPPGETDPGFPGEWDQDVYPGPPGCAAVSPSGAEIACVNASPWIFGDWELSVFPFGRARDEHVLLRANGSLPLLGWAADETALYYQNETGIWKVPL